MAINFDHQRDRISTNSRILTVNTNGALTIPVGTNGQRPTSGPSGGLATGQIRFNSQLSAFEGYNGIAWSSLGGVIDVDQDTKITVESSPGADEDTLTFFTAGQIRATIDENGDTVFAGNVQIDGTLTVDGIATLKAGTSGTINLGDDNTDNVVFQADVNSSIIPNIDAVYDLGSTTQNWRNVHTQSLDSNTDVITIDLTGALILPVGTTFERPVAVTGMIRFNTDDSRFEAYDGTAWTGVGGVIDVDQDTFIRAETSPGANNNDLDFFTNSVQRLQIDETGDFLFGDNLNKFTIDFDTGNIFTAGDVQANEFFGIVDGGTF